MNHAYVMTPTKKNRLNLSTIVPKKIKIINLIPEHGFYMNYVEDKLTINLINSNLRFNIDFLCPQILNRINKNIKKPNIIKSIEGRIYKNKSLNILDMTAGFGYDAFTIASYGHNITAIESNIYIYLMLKDALLRCNNTFLSRIANRINLKFDDSQFILTDFFHDVIYIDPMFDRNIKATKVKKRMQILKTLLKTDQNNEINIFKKATLLNSKKIVVKRPIKGKIIISSIKPNSQIIGTRNRFDIYIK